MIRRSLMATLVAVISLGALVSGASAATTPVKTEVVAQLKMIQANPEFKSLKTFKVKNVRDAQEAIPKLDTLRALYLSAGKAVAASRATTAAQRAGRRDWVAAVRSNASGIGDIVTGLDKYVAGKKDPAALEIDKGIKLDVTANQYAIKAYKLLGIRLS